MSRYNTIYGVCAGSITIWSRYAIYDRLHISLPKMAVCSQDLLWLVANQLGNHHVIGTMMDAHGYERVAQAMHLDARHACCLDVAKKRQRHGGFSKGSIPAEKKGRIRRDAFHVTIKL